MRPLNLQLRPSLRLWQNNLVLTSARATTLPLTANKLHQTRALGQSSQKHHQLFINARVKLYCPRRYTLLQTQATRHFTTTMSLSAQELKGYLADSPPSVVRLEIAKHFDALTDKQKRYAHYISK